MFKLNLHAHTRYSDGNQTIRQMAEVYKDLGFSCAVFTDHVYGIDAPTEITLSRDKYERALKEAEEVSKELDFPIFLGAEFCLGQFEETLVYGTEAVRYLLWCREHEGYVNYNDLRNARVNSHCAAILAHPIKPYLFVFEDCIDGYEFMNHGRCMFTRLPIPKNFKHLTPWGNSDAHCDYDIGLGWNLVDVDVKTEDQLIDLIKNSAPVGFDGVEWRTIGDLMLMVTE